MLELYSGGNIQSLHSRRALLLSAPVSQILIISKLHFHVLKIQQIVTIYGTCWQLQKCYVHFMLLTVNVAKPSSSIRILILLLIAYPFQEFAAQMSVQNRCLSSATLLAVAIVLNISVMSFSHLCLGFPLLLFAIPCIIKFKFSKPSCRVMWPKYF